jgi:phosphatidylinositol alpha-1,6-mannosyltransferase
MARMYFELCRHFPVGHIEVAAPAGARTAEIDAALPHVPVHRFAFDYEESGSLITALQAYRWTRNRLKRGDIGVLQLGNFRPTGYVAYWLRRRVPYVVYVHGLDIWKEQQRSRRSKRVRTTARAVLGNAAAFIANSHPVAAHTRDILSELGVDAANRIHVVHPGTDAVRFRRDEQGRTRWRERLGLQDRQVLLTVGRLEPRKGIDVVLRSLPALTERFPDVTYVVAGSGADAGRLSQVARDAGVSDRVCFVGEFDDAELPALYSAADVFVLPAREERERNQIEGFGIVYCEAAAAALPVVAGASGGVADAVRAGETALLVPPTDVDAVTAALDTLLRDADLRARMGEAGRRSVEEYFNWPRAARAVWQILEQVAARRIPKLRNAEF